MIIAPLDQREDQQEHGCRDDENAAEIVLHARIAGDFRNELRAEDQRQNADRNVHEEDRPPGEPTEVGADDQPAQHRPDDRGETCRQTEEREGRGTLMRREDRLRNGEHLRRHDRAAHALQKPGDDEELNVRGETAHDGGYREAADADEEHLLLADDVAIAAEGQKPEREGEDEAGDDPFDIGRAGAHVMLQRRQRDIDDGDVEQVHEACHQDDGHGRPALLIGRIRLMVFRGRGCHETGLLLNGDDGTNDFIGHLIEDLQQMSGLY